MNSGFSRLALGLGLSLVLAAGSYSVIAQETSSSSSSLEASSSSEQAAPAAEPTPEQVLAGKRVWIDAACFNCHGTNGQGGSSKDFPHGPSLRKSQLDTETMHEVIACGLPGTLMPGWAKGAYTEERPCFGITDGVPEGTRVVSAYDEQQLNDLIAYIETTFRKKS